MNRFGTLVFAGVGGLAPTLRLAGAIGLSLVLASAPCFAADQPATDSGLRTTPTMFLTESSIGALEHDGPATPEQLALYLPILDESLESGVTATVRYSNGGTWREAHPLFRIRPEFSARNEHVRPGFAGVIVDLEPDTEYKVEVRVRGTQGIVRRSVVMRTRALPKPAGRASKNVRPEATSAEIQAMLDAANPGDVILFHNGVYHIENLAIKRSGSPQHPIYLRGESRDGVRIVDRTNSVLYLVGASDIVIENLTLEGSGEDSGTKASSAGIRVWDGEAAERITVRNVTIRDVDQGIVGGGKMSGFLVYDTTLVGNDVYEKATLESNASWNDDGIRVPGKGHAVFNNTLSGFGDALAMSARQENAGVHFYRNRVLFTCDDAYEGDYGTRNITFYDNRIQNSMTLASFDPLYGGPAFVFRNVAINVGRQPYKLNNKNTGMLIYNNTVVRIPGFRGGATWGWVQSNNGALRAWAYRNNILHFSGPNPLALESPGNDPIDFDHNAWFPDGKVWWTRSGGSFRSIGVAHERMRETQSLFGPSRKRHDHDVILERQPFASEIWFNATYDIPVAPLYEPSLSENSAARHAGVPIPGITDGFSGAKPDIGAVITGRRSPVVGDRTKG